MAELIAVFCRLCGWEGEGYDTYLSPQYCPDCGHNNCIEVRDGR